MFVDHFTQYRISPWRKTAGKRGFYTRVMDRRTEGSKNRRRDGQTDRRTDRPSYEYAFLTDASKNDKTLRICSFLYNFGFISSRGPSLCDARVNQCEDWRGAFQILQLWLYVFFRFVLECVRGVGVGGCCPFSIKIMKKIYCNLQSASHYSFWSRTSRVLYTPLCLSVCPSFGWSVTFYFFYVFGLTALAQVL